MCRLVSLSVRLLSRVLRLRSSVIWVNSGQAVILMLSRSLNCLKLFDKSNLCGCDTVSNIIRRGTAFIRRYHRFK